MTCRSRKKGISVDFSFWDKALHPSFHINCLCCSLCRFFATLLIASMLGSMWLCLDLFKPVYVIISCLLTRIENWIILTYFSQTEKFLTRNGTGTQGTMPIEYELSMIQRIKMENDYELPTQANSSHILLRLPTLVLSSIHPWLDLALFLDYKRKWEQSRGVLPNTGNLSFRCKCRIHHSIGQDYYNITINQKFKQLLQRGKLSEDHSVLLNDTLDCRLSVMQLATQYIAYLNLEFSDGMAFETGFWLC